MRTNRSLPRCCLVLFALLVLAGFPARLPAAPAQVPAPVQSLAQRIRAHLASPRFQSAQWGIHVVSLDTGQTLFECNKDQYFVPASNAKLFTCAMALAVLGPDRRLCTSVYAAGQPDPGGLLKGDLVFYGRGDPLLMARWRGGPALPDPLEALAAQVKAAGVKVIQGDVIGDDSFLRNRPAGSGWEVLDRDYAYGADVSALTLHDNMVELRIYPALSAGGPCLLFPMPGLGLLPLGNRTTTGPASPLRADWTAQGLEVTGSLPPGTPPVTLAVPVREPALFAARLLRRALERQGITVQGGTRVMHAKDRTAKLDTAALVELASVASPPLREVVRATLKDSVNLYAQLLLLQAGGSEAAGLATLRAFLKEAGVRPDGALLEEGAGLSRKDLVKPEAVTALLKAMRARPEAAAFQDALPLAAVDGTLRDRMGGTRAAVNVRAKTGTLKYTHALSGYLTTAGGDHLAFAIFLNNYLPSGPDGPSPQADVDALAVMLAEANAFDCAASPATCRTEGVTTGQARPR